jgi:acyl-CoA thioesterase II
MTDETPASAENFAALVEMVPCGPGHFRNRCSDLDFQGGHMFGGQLVAQALAAAMQTLEGRRVHSLHGYFLRPGNVRAPVDFLVETTRDGRSFSTRRVRAQQDGKRLYEMQCSASVEQEGALDHQDAPLTGIPAPEDLPTLADLLASGDYDDCRPALERLGPMDGVDVRPVNPEALFRPGTAPGARVWLRVPSLAGPIDHAMQACMIAYLQDYWIAYAPWTYQRGTFDWDGPSVASLDSNVWFHRAVEADWLLYDLASPTGSGGVGFTSGRLFDRAGNLVASASQEVLYRG